MPNEKNQQPPKIIADRLNFSVLAWVNMVDVKINRELIACHWKLVRVPVEIVASKELEKTFLLKKYVHFWRYFSFKQPLYL